MPDFSLVDIRDGAELLVIGGVPRSGKTLLTKQLWQQAGVPGMCVDSIVLAFSHFAPEVGIGWAETPERAQKMLSVAQMVSITGLRTFDRYFIEGESLSPQVADALRQNFRIRACFLTLDQPRIEDVVQYEEADGWVSHVPPEERDRVAAELADRSHWITEQCIHYGFDHVDMSRGAYSDRVDDALTLLISRAQQDA